jgi:hypothetical protein
MAGKAIGPWYRRYLGSTHERRRRQGHSNAHFERLPKSDGMTLLATGAAGAAGHCGSDRLRL